YTMENLMDLYSTEDGYNSSNIVLEKQVFRSKVSESHVQLACSLHYCAFPLNGNELCIWNMSDDPNHQPLHLIGHHHSITALAFGTKVNPLLLCSASHDYVIVWNLDECTKKVLEGLMPQGIVIGTLLGMVLYVRFSPDDQTVAICAGNRIYMLNAKDETILSELEGHLAPVTAAEFCTWEKNILISISEDRSFKVWDYSLGLLIYQSAVITAFPLLSLFIDEANKQIITGCADGQLWIFSLISGHQYRCVIHINIKKERKKFYNKITKFEHLGNVGFPEVSTQYLWIGSSTGLFIINNANFELEAALHYKDFTGLSIQICGSCALRRKAVNGKHGHVFPKFKSKAQQVDIGMQETLETEDYPLGKSPPTKSVRQITVTDKPTAICCIQHSGNGELLACGLADRTLLAFKSNLIGEPTVYSGHDGAITSVGWSHDNNWLVSSSEDRTLKIWSVSSAEPSLCLDAYADIVLAAGSNRALEIFDLNVGCSAALIRDAHSRSIHQICQNKGSSFSCQPHEAYNLFLTAAIGDGIKLWDLRTLRVHKEFFEVLDICKVMELLHNLMKFG
ncbi:hypothetical protein Chor_006515, partial [Crotalus horridus]